MDKSRALSGIMASREARGLSDWRLFSNRKDGSRSAYKDTLKVRAVLANDNFNSSISGKTEGLKIHRFLAGRTSPTAIILAKTDNKDSDLQW